MPVIGDEYYRCHKCGEGWFVEQRRFRIRRDRDLEFFSEEEAFTTPAPTTQAQIDYLCANCGEPLVRNGLRYYVRRPPVMVAALRDELAGLKQQMQETQEKTDPPSHLRDGLDALKAIQELAERIGRLEELIQIGPDASAGSVAGSETAAGEDHQPGGNPPADGVGAKATRKKSK